MRTLIKLLFLTVTLVAVAAVPSVAQKRPKIEERKAWGAKDSVGVGRKHKIAFITIHHTATLQKPAVPIATKMRNLQAFSQREDKLDTGKVKPAWFDIPYHYYIAADGQIAEGREIKYAGDTNTEYDPTGHALVVLEGSFNTEQPALAQIKSMRQIVAWLARKYKVNAVNIKGHDDYAKTGCPGGNLKKLLPEVRQLVNR